MREHENISITMQEDSTTYTNAQQETYIRYEDLFAVGRDTDIYTR